MADTAYQTQYRAEAIAAFEQGESLLRQCVTTEADVNGTSAVFLVAGSGSTAQASTRGVNGLIPARADDLNQYTATLVEWHDLVRRTRFNLEMSQGNGRQIMQRTTRNVMNRKIDADILAALELGTQDTGAAQTMTLALAMYGVAILGNNAVPFDGNITTVITPGAYAYLMQTKEFTSADYVAKKPFTGNSMMFQWANINWIVHPNLTGKGTAAEKCIMFHKDAIGHAVDLQQLDIQSGYDAEQDYSWARTSGFMGSKLLQDTGIVVITHDGSAFAAQ